MAYLPFNKDHVGKTWPNPLEWNDQRVHWLAAAEKTRDFYNKLRRRYENTPVYAQTTYQADYCRRLPLANNNNPNHNDLRFKFGRNAAFAPPSSPNERTVPMPPTATYNMEQMNCPTLDFLRCNDCDERPKSQQERVPQCSNATCSDNGNFTKYSSDNNKFPSMMQHYNRRPGQDNNNSAGNEICRRCCCSCCNCGSGAPNQSCYNTDGVGGRYSSAQSSGPNKTTTTVNCKTTYCTDKSSCNNNNNNECADDDARRLRPFSVSTTSNRYSTTTDMPVYGGSGSNAITKDNYQRFTTKRPSNVSLDDRLKADQYYDYTTTTTTTTNSSRNGDYDPSDKNSNIPPRYKTLLVTDNAEKLRAKSNQLVEREEERAKTNQADVERQLADRVADTNFWRSELRNEANEMAQEMAKLRHVISQLERRTRELDGPLSTNAECQVMRTKLKLATRDSRNNNGEQVDKDRADQEMQAEYNMLMRYQAQLNALTRQMREKLQQEEQIHRELEADGSDKFDAITIDRHCQRMQLTSPEVVYRDKSLRGTPPGGYMSDPQSWKENSERKLRYARNLRSDSHKQRIEAEKLLSQMCSELTAQCHAVNDELLKKSIFNEQRKMRVREQYTKTCMRINDMERDVEMLARVLNSRQSPLALAQTRVAARTGRPNMELCDDHVEYKLRSEIDALQASTQKLNDQLRAVQYSLAELRQVKAGMETEMLNAATSVYVDREKCLGLRKQYPVLFRVGTPNV